MSEQSKPWAEQWLAGQQAMWNAFQPGGAAAAAQAGSHDAAAHGSSALESQFDELRDTWKASLAKWTEFAQEAASGETPSPARLREMFTPASWSGPGAGVLDAALQRVLEGPRYATLWDLDRQLLELQRSTAQRDREVAAYQAVLNKAWNLVFERFSKALNDGQKDSAPRSWRSLADRWLAVANETLIEVYRSQEFLDAQRRMLRAASDRHLQERRIAEAWCVGAHVPTRSEVDELQRLVVELRREVRLLRRTSPLPPAASQGAAKRPARRARAKPAKSGD